ncbi:hypothetical protein WMF26_44155 [Sorangium sp. So ce185]|uniref:hypothetical protein n=1 Tax=Sorangium sp. So ce185 TaxID=3133287 RepID=UPI003F63E6C9
MGSRLRAALAAAVMAASISAVHDVFAEPEDDGLEEQEKACNDNVTYFRSRVDNVVMWSSIFMITGAVISATGSALAGFLNSNSRRKAAAIVGALGAVLTVTPKVLPDKEHLLASLSSAEKHRLVGTKIRNQFQFARPGESLVDAQKYVSARFTDCASLDPPQGVPELPSLDPVSSYEPTPVAQTPEPISVAHVPESISAAQTPVVASSDRSAQFARAAAPTTAQRSPPHAGDNRPGRKIFQPAQKPTIPFDAARSDF